jgi:hypothetical protein
MIFNGSKEPQTTEKKMLNPSAEVRTEIRINAAPQNVWRVLTDFKNYPNWNPFIKSIQGDLKVGGKLMAVIAPPDSNAMTFKPTVLVATPNREFRWLGHFIIPGLFDGEHIFELLDNGDGTTTLVHREEFKGMMVSMMKKMLDDNTKRGFEMMNAALKKEAEA